MKIPVGYNAGVQWLANLATDIRDPIHGGVCVVFRWSLIQGAQHYYYFPWSCHDNTPQSQLNYPAPEIRRSFDWLVGTWRIIPGRHVAHAAQPLTDSPSGHKATARRQKSSPPSADRAAEAADAEPARRERGSE